MITQMQRRIVPVIFGLVLGLSNHKSTAEEKKEEEPFLTRTDLFTAQQEGYALYRIPGIICTKKGTLLAYCEARKHLGSDWGHIDILMRRSSDGGKTWTERQQVARLKGKFERNPAAVAQKLGVEGEITINNPVAFADRSGAVHFLYSVEYSRCFYLRSDDEGQTFSEPVEITSAMEKFRDRYAWKVFGIGPGHGIQLRSGRLVVPLWMSTGTGGHAHRPSCVSVIYSDNGGAAWRTGDIIAADPDPVANPNESTLVELSDGSVMINIRHESKPRFRGVSISPDGATRWTPFRMDKQLPEPVCMASLIRLSGKPNRIVFSNPNNPDGTERKNLTIRLSEDDGKTWPVSKTLEAGPSGYSDLTVLPDGTICCFYERGTLEGNFRTRALCVARFNLAWLKGGQ